MNYLELEQGHTYLTDHFQIDKNIHRKSLQPIKVIKQTQRATLIEIPNKMNLSGNDILWVLKEWDINIIEDITQ